MKLIIPDHVKITEINERTVLLDCKKNFYYAVSKSGTEFLNQIKIHGDMVKAIEKISNDYGVAQEVVENDMNIFVDRLIQKGLVIKK
ncbi:PqqD family protein [Thermoflavimicrobium daqui]|uniref:Coenzyme PQQ synthesis protein D (PqqD) n=1 Tax=Thermoflavimicrobium daqui TaxID=2137476 RepID=A0A364K601_9BACL|nr:hypothetical protein DL897_06455 [Thermoflavimicrobium daqui]